MTPEADHILRNSAAQIMSELAPLLPAGYAQGALMLHAILILFAAREYERGAEIRAAENADLRALFRDCGAVVTDAALKDAIARASETSDESLAISALTESNAALRKLLIALHAHVEDCDGPAARDAERRIWTALKILAARRLVVLG
jgi:predicted metal-dependent HD superfamily phosphohydrolase